MWPCAWSRQGTCSTSVAGFRGARASGSRSTRTGRSRRCCGSASALDPARPLTAHAAALTGLAVACGLGFRLDLYQTQGRRSVQDAVAQLGTGLQELIAQTQTAVDSAVLSHRT